MTSKPAAALVVLPADDPRGYRAYGGAAELWKAREHEVILSGPYECVAGETVIYDPATGTAATIAELAAAGRPTHVLTMRGARPASAPFRKGTARLYRVTVDDGRSFVATKRHRVLTDLGWRCVAELEAGVSRLVCAPGPPASTSEPGPGAFRPDAHRLNRKPRDCQASCSVGPRPCGEPLRTGQGNGPARPPLPGGVPARSCGDRRTDGREPLQEYSRPGPLPARPSIGHCAGPYDLASHRVCREPLETCGPSGASILTGPPFRPALDRRQSTTQDQECCFRGQALVSSPLLFDGPGSANYRGHTCTVSTVEYERTDEYFDIHVPGAEHYIAEGFIHHNTGKTLGALNKLNALLVKYAGSRALMVRKTYRSLVESACVTFENKVLATPVAHPQAPVRRHGGSNPTGYLYSNGSRIVLGGMDNPNKVLSTEWDFIYVNQAEELVEDEWQALTGRATGRAENAPYGQVLGDCNPAAPTHWILRRKSLRLLESRHEENPTLYDQATGEITERGKVTMGVLNALTGVRLQRGRFGKWVAAEGQVYEQFDRAVHVVPRFDAPAEWPRIWAIDWGFTNPFVWQEWALDHDRRMFLVRELYATRLLVETAAALIMAATKGEAPPAAIVCDHDAEDRATFERHTGYKTLPAYKAIGPGLEAVQSRLGWPASSDRPARPATLFILADNPMPRDEALVGKHKAASSVDEYELYIWPKGTDGKAMKEAPIDDNNHGMDATRYAVAYVDQIHLAYDGRNADYSIDEDVYGSELGPAKEWIY